MDIERMWAIAQAVQACFDLTDDLGELMSVIGCSLDYWAANHGLSGEEMEAALEGLLCAARSAHEILGMPEKGEC